MCKISFHWICLSLFSLAIVGHSADLAYIGQTPTDAPSSSFPGVGSLYNGQFTEAFPLASIGTGGGPEVQLTLQYSSNIHSVVDKSNRDHQASWVGLGFGMGGEAIVANNHYTMDIDDDEYFYVGGGTSTRLYCVNRFNRNSFVLANGALWSIERHVDTLNGREHVIGWTIVKEDGTTYKFGDFGLYNEKRNASRYQLAWGGTVGVGTSGGDSLVAFQWDVKRIEDIPNVHFLEYSYFQELDSVKVVNPTNGNYSDNYYTRCSYPAFIASDIGDTIKFILDDRDDFEKFHGDIYQEFISEKKLSAIYMLNDCGDTLSRTCFYHSYLNSTKENKYKKLLLDSLVVFGSDGSHLSLQRHLTIM